ncbi:hypothetical protein [Psychroserpens sp.]
MKTFYITIFCCLALTSYSFSQQNELSDSEKNQLKRYEEDVKRNKLKYITSFVTSLKVDAFQEEIITQTLNNYFDELVKINKLRLKHYEREAQIDQLDKRHFKDIKSMVTEDVMIKIMDAAQGQWSEKEEKKKRKKKKKQQNRDNN